MENPLLVFLTNLHTDFQSGWTSFIPHQQCSVQGNSFLQRGQCLLLFLMAAVQTGVRWNPNVAGVCPLAGHPDVIHHVPSTLSFIGLKLADQARMAGPCLHLSSAELQAWASFF